MEEPQGTDSLKQPFPLDTWHISWAAPSLPTLHAFRTGRSSTWFTRRNKQLRLRLMVRQPSLCDSISNILRISSDLNAHLQSGSKSRKASTLQLRVLQQRKKNRSWKLQRLRFLREKHWARKIQICWAQFTALLQASCQEWDKPVRCYGPVP